PHFPTRRSSDLSSTQQPSGTAFSVFLPLQKDYRVKQVAEEPQQDLKEKPVILIIEDHAELAQFIADHLKKDYNILMAKDGIEGLKTASEKMPDLILSDVNMEGMDGFEICNAVRRNININHIPIILLTAKSDM